VIVVGLVESSDDWSGIENQTHAERNGRAAGLSRAAASAMLCSELKVPRRGWRCCLSSSARRATTDESLSSYGNNAILA
jgi:hypothetical protein